MSEPYAKQCHLQGGPAKRVLLFHFSEEEIKVQTIVSKGCLLFSWPAGGASGWARSIAKPEPRRGPAQTPPRPRPTEETGRLCLPAQSVIGLRDWTGRNDWVGLSTGRGRGLPWDFWGVASGTAPFRGLKGDSGCRGGARTRRPIPTQFFGSRRGAAPRRGRTGTGNCKGHLGLGQAGSMGLLGTTEGIRGPGQR